LLRQSAYADQKNQDSKGKVRALTDLHYDIVTLSALFLIVVATRVLFAGQVLYHWDSINFAFALQHFDVAEAQPHVPGYILYVLLGRAVNLLVNDAQTALVGISVVSSGLAAVSLYLLGRDMFNRWVGAVAALFLAASPLFWFYGEIALPHSLDTFAVIFSVWLFYRLIRGDGWFSTYWAAAAAAAWFGIAGGLRPQTQLFLMPLALYTAWRIGFKRSLVSFSVLVVVNFTWLVPLIVLSGGIAAYMEVFGNFSEYFNTTTSVFHGAGVLGLARNLRKLVSYSLYGWGLAVLPFMLAAVVWLFSLRKLFASKWKSNRRRLFTWMVILVEDSRIWIFLLWFGPVLMYYTFIHMGQQGLVFVFLPALMLLSAASLYSLFEKKAMLRQAAVAAVVLSNGLIFIFLPTEPLGGSFRLLTYDTIRHHDETHLVLLEGIRENFPAEHTVIVASWWRFPEYYLSEYPLIHYNIRPRGEIDEGKSNLADQTVDRAKDMGVMVDPYGYLNIDPAWLGVVPDQDGDYYMLLFDNALADFNLSDERHETITLGDGRRMTYFQIGVDERFYLGSEYFDVINVNN
jgi:4-amino-4-deoxy-L-arabinose transferase-like glycosyltransferase